MSEPGQPEPFPGQHEIGSGWLMPGYGPAPLEYAWVLLNSQYQLTKRPLRAANFEGPPNLPPQWGYNYTLEKFVKFGCHVMSLSWVNNRTKCAGLIQFEDEMLGIKANNTAYNIEQTNS